MLGEIKSCLHVFSEISGSNLLYRWIFPTNLEEDWENRTVLWQPTGNTPSQQPPRMRQVTPQRETQVGVLIYQATRQKRQQGEKTTVFVISMSLITFSITHVHSFYQFLFLH